MILPHEDYQAIENEVPQGKATAIIRAFEKLEREQKVEVKKDLLMELATTSDIAELRGATKADIAELRGAIKADIAELRGVIKADIANLEARFEKRFGDLEVRFEKRFGELEARFGKLETLMKFLIGAIIVGTGFFSPITAELIKLIK